jgi:hypothetical protein
VVCRVFKKKHHHKESGGGGGGKHGSSNSERGHGGAGKASAAAAGNQLHGGLQYSSSDEALDQILQYMGRSCKPEHALVSPAPAPPGRAAASRYLRPIETVLGGHAFMKLPALESPSAAAAASLTQPAQHDELYRAAGNGITDWAMMDRLVASHLNGQQAPAAADQLGGGCGFDADAGAEDADAGLAFYSAAASRLLGSGGGAGSDDDLWSFTRSSVSSTAAAAATSTERLSHVSL